MGESLFSADYYREMIYAHVDNINLLYVAPDTGRGVAAHLHPAEGSQRDNETSVSD